MTRWLLLTIAILLALQVASTWGDEPELLIEATPAQYVDNCGRFHTGPALLKPDRMENGVIIPTDDKGVA